MENITLEWFFKMPGLFVTAGIVLILVAILIFLIAGIKSKSRVASDSYDTDIPNNTKLELDNSVEATNETPNALHLTTPVIADANVVTPPVETPKPIEPMIAPEINSQTETPSTTNIELNSPSDIKIEPIAPVVTPIEEVPVAPLTVNIEPVTPEPVTVEPVAKVETPSTTTYEEIEPKPMATIPTEINQATNLPIPEPVNSQDQTVVKSEEEII